MFRKIRVALDVAAKGQKYKGQLLSTSRSLRVSPHHASRPRRYDRSAFGEGKEARSEGSGGTGGYQRSLIQVMGTILGVGGVVYVSNQEGVPITKRSHLILFPSSWEPSIGKAAVQTAVPEDAKVLPHDHPRTQAVRFIVDSLAQHIGSLEGLPPHLKDIEWHVTVVDHNMVNAMAAPGGQVLVFTGIMDLLSNRNELAAVIAHEMAHVLARHSAESITGQIVFLPVSIGLALILDMSTNVFGQLHKLMVGLPGSRANEREADLIGMHLAARACYPPEGMVSMLKKLDQQERRGGSKGPPVLLRTHPLTSERVEECRRRVPEVQQVLEASGCDPFLSQFSVSSMLPEAFSPPQMSSL